MPLKVLRTEKENAEDNVHFYLKKVDSIIYNIYDL